MYVQYKVNVSENQVVTLKDAIQLEKGATFCLLLEVIMSCYLHQHKSIDWAWQKWKGDGHKFV